ncbi:hypothetical protein BJ742DRAFT_70882 [Cladochytrium replicatum]|nr:hypothetical protein BJ742DRAFT_70882 [Cladochytrium replicatum]
MSNVTEIPLSTWTIRGQGAPINILASSIALLASCFGLYSAAHFLRAAVRIRDEQRKKDVKKNQENKKGGVCKETPGEDNKRNGKKVKPTDELHIHVETKSDRTPLHLKVKVAWLPVVAWAWLLLADSWTLFVTTSPDVDVVWPTTTFDSIGTYFLLVYFILVFSTLSGLINYRKGVKIALIVVSTIIFILSVTVYTLAELNTATLITDFPPSDGVNNPPVFTNGNGSFIQSEYSSTADANKASKNDTDGLRVQVIYKFENLPFRAGDYGTGVLISLGLLWFVSLSTWLAVAACFVLARVRGIFGEWRSAVQRAGSMRRWLNLDPQWDEQGGSVRRTGTASIPVSGPLVRGEEPWSDGRRGGRSRVVAQAATPDPRDSRWGAATVVRVADATSRSVRPVSSRSSVLQGIRATPEIRNVQIEGEMDAPPIVISDTASEISAYPATLQTPSSSVFSSVLLQTVEREESEEPADRKAAQESFAAPKRPHRTPLVVAVPDSEPTQQRQGANAPPTPEIAPQPSPNSDRSPQLPPPTGAIPTHKWMDRLLLPVPRTRFSRRATLNPSRSQPPPSAPEPPTQSSQHSRQSASTRVKFTPPPPPPTATHMSESNVLARASAASLITGVSASYGVVLALMIPFLIPGAPPVPLNSVCVLAMRAGYLLAAFGFSRAMEVGAWSADRLTMHSGITNARQQSSGLDADVGGRRRFRREMNPQHLEIYRSFESSKPMFFPPHPQAESPAGLGESRRRRSEAAAATVTDQARDFELIPMPEALRARASVIISVHADGGVEEYEYDETMDDGFLDEIVEEWYPEHMFASVYAAHDRPQEDESGYDRRRVGDEPV